MKSVQPALDKISAAENGKCFNAIANLFDIADEAQPLMDKVKTSFAASSRSSLMKKQYIYHFIVYVLFFVGTAALKI